MKSLISNISAGRIFVFAVILNLSLIGCETEVNSPQESLNQPSWIESKSTGGAKYRNFMRQKRGYASFEVIAQARKALRKYQHSDSRLRRRKDAGLKSWTWLGPANIGGRVRALVVVPNKSNPAKEDIIIGSASGGIWKSVDEGASWYPVNDFLPSLTFSSIVVHPNNPDTLYAGSGEALSVTIQGSGIFRSTDRGETWSVLPSTNNPEFYHVNRLAIDKNSPKTIFASTSILDSTGFGESGKIFKSTDGGDTWTEKDSSSSPLIDIEIDPYNSNNILVGGTYTLLRSTNGGESFHSIVGGIDQMPLVWNRAELAFAPSDSGLVFASVGYTRHFSNRAGELWRSTDHGASWFPIDTTSNLLYAQPIWNNTLWVDPLNSSHLMVGGVMIHRSINGGVSFSQLTDETIHSDCHLVVPSLFYSQSKPKVFLATDGGVHQHDSIWTSPPDTGWINLANQSLGITQLYTADVDIFGQYYGGGTQDNGGVVSLSQNTSWNKVIGGDGTSFLIKPEDPTIMYGSSQYGSLFKSVDNGNCFPHLANFNTGTSTGTYDAFFGFLVNDSPIFGAPLSLDPDTTSTLYFGGRRIWKSLDEGSTWKELRIAVGGVTTCSALDSKSGQGVIIAGYNDGYLSLSKDGGNNWSSNLNTSGMPDRFVTSVAINPLDAGKCLVSFGGYHNKQIWLTQDTGANWTNISFDIPIHVESLTWHPQNPNWIYAGSDFGIFATEDLGETWSTIPVYGSSTDRTSNEGPAYVQVSDLFWDGDGSDLLPHHLYAATFGRGLWKTTYPITSKVYVDKNCGFCGKGTMTQPFSTLQEALAKTGSGVDIQFISDEVHDEIPGTIIIGKRRKILAPTGKRVIIE